MNILKVENLCKSYKDFQLDNVSFTLPEGYIMGFIGSNGAGKTTTLKGILNLIHTENGTVEILGKDFKANEIALKQDVAFMVGENNYYRKKKIGLIAEVVSRFYMNWDQSYYEKLLKRFKLDPEKKIQELSQGMKVKFSLALALSHKAKLILLDEPTSGLDPVARDDLLEIFQELIEDGKKSILFSTHITNDLEKCADYITFISNGRIIESTEKDIFLENYRIISGSAGILDDIKSNVVSYKTHSLGFSALIENEKISKIKPFNGSLNVKNANLDDIMIYFSKKDQGGSND
ncbi:MAG: ABC transporter ATP-binding protein [Spirochaetales bacterium]|nr:ABC transporter ATP-binding protein [Spirochaetales bacterium]